MYASSEQAELLEYLSDCDTRHLYLDSHIRQLVAMQLRAMREDREWSQAQVGEKAGGIKQSGIARLEDPRYASMTLSTLKRLAKAFDVALIVRFAPFSELVDWVTQLDQSRLGPPSYEKEREDAAATDTSSAVVWPEPTAHRGPTVKVGCTTMHDTGFNVGADVALMGSSTGETMGVGFGATHQSQPGETSSRKEGEYAYAATA